MDELEELYIRALAMRKQGLINDDIIFNCLLSCAARRQFEIFVKDNVK